MAPHYRHTQTGRVIIGSIAAAMLIVVPLVIVPGAPLGVLAVVLPLVLAGFLFSTLTVEIDALEMRIFFTGGLIRRRVALAELRSQRPVRNPWIYGWGIHKIPGGWIWNVSGLDAVELTLADGRILRVGTDEPLALSRAIATATPTVRSAPAGSTAPASDGRRRWHTLAGTIVVLAVLALVGSAYLQTRPPEVTVTHERLSIRSLFYGGDYPFSEITGSSLEPRLPRVLARTNGFAGGGLLRGWFRLQGLGDGKLFVDQATPPFLLVRLKQGFVIVNFAEPERTRALHEEIEHRRPR